ncbi:MAG: processing protein [Actinoplanes sp.]|jgi:DNA processing protein|nr:processing protein [Actinoplanes sp.]
MSTSDVSHYGRSPRPIPQPAPPTPAAWLSGHIDQVRAARAGLAWLFDPAAPVLRDLLDGRLPFTGIDQLTDQTLTEASGVRREIRHYTPAALRAGAAAAVTKAAASGMRVVVPEDTEWPAGLADLSDPGRAPAGSAALCLWVRGDWTLAYVLQTSIAVVGARAATAYGLHVAQEFGYELASRGWTVVNSGGFGVDGAAQRGALSDHGLGVAALPCGLDRPHPAGHQSLFERIAGSGLLVSMWPPGSEPGRDRAVVNRALLAALACGTVVVEAAAVSGAISTLRHSVAAGRPAMVVPGPVTSAMSAGCHRALRDIPQVRLVTGAVEVVAELSAADVNGGDR